MAPNGTVLKKAAQTQHCVQSAARGVDVSDRQSFSELLTPTMALSVLETIAGPWQTLAQTALERNPFFEPWALMPAFQNFSDDGVRLACVWSAPDRSQLLALAPMRAMRGYARLPVGYWGTWLHPHCFYGAPLIDRDRAREACASLCALLCDGDQARSFLRLFRLDEAGAVAAAFDGAAQTDGRYCYSAGRYERAALFSGPTPEEFIATNIRKKKAKEFSRLHNRLSEKGEIIFRQLTDQSQLEEWGREFLRLENLGWRGKAKTSLLSSNKDVVWFEAVLAGAYDAGQLSFMRLDVAGQAIAMLACFGQTEKYSIKICHDPGFARYSPGVMIELAATKKFLGDDNFSFIDSCAARDHSMINSLWPQRRCITGLNIAGLRGQRLLRLCRRLEDVRVHAGRGVGALIKLMRRVP